MEDSSRFCSEVTTSIAEARCGFVAAASRASRASTVLLQQRGEDELRGVRRADPSISTRRMLRLGNVLADGPQIGLEPAHHHLVAAASARTGTPRQKRCGSSISRSAEKLLLWPLCGVAERKSRCSKRGARSRTARVSLESMAYLAPLEGAALCASSRMSSEPLLKLPQPVAKRARRRLSSRMRAWEMMKRVCVFHGLIAQPALLSHARDVLAVVDDEGQTEALLHLVAPLADHRRRARRSRSGGPSGA